MDWAIGQACTCLGRTLFVVLRGYCNLRSLDFSATSAQKLNSTSLSGCKERDPDFE